MKQNVLTARLKTCRWLIIAFLRLQIDQVLNIVEREYPTSREVSKTLILPFSHNILSFIQIR